MGGRDDPISTELIALCDIISPNQVSDGSGVHSVILKVFLLNRSFETIFISVTSRNILTLDFAQYRQRQSAYFI